MEKEKVIDKWQSTTAYKKLNKITSVIMKVLRIMALLGLAYSATVLYAFGSQLLAGGIGLILCLYMIFAWLDALSKQGVVK